VLLDKAFGHDVSSDEPAVPGIRNTNQSSEIIGKFDVCLRWAKLARTVLGCFNGNTCRMLPESQFTWNPKLPLDKHEQRNYPVRFHKKTDHANVSPPET